MKKEKKYYAFTVSKWKRFIVWRSAPAPQRPPAGAGSRKCAGRMEFSGASVDSSRTKRLKDHIMTHKFAKPHRMLQTVQRLSINRKPISKNGERT